MSLPRTRTRLPRSTRIGIVGAGCAGLAAAEELAESGHDNVVVLEAHRRVGGKVHTIERDGVQCEGGAVWFVPGPVYEKLMDRHGLTRELSTLGRVKLYDLATGTMGSPFLYAGRSGLLARAGQFLRLLAELPRHGQPDGSGLAGLLSEPGPLAQRCPAWMSAQRFDHVRDSLVPLAIGAQLGPAEPEVSAGYLMRLLALLTRFPLHRQLGLRLPQLSAGNQELWRRVAARHDVRLGEPVRRLSRGSGSGAEIVVRTDAGEHRFDRLIWTAPVDHFLAAAGDDAREGEREVFSRVLHGRRSVLTYRVEGLPPDGFYIVRDALDGKVPASYPHVAYEVRRGSGIFNFYPYPDAATSEKELDAGVQDLVRRLGGRSATAVGAPLHWKWFPHFSPDDVAAGMHGRAEALQGAGGVWFGGELYAGIGVAYGTEYAARLVQRMAG
jgi:hypothetical protein